MQTATAVIEHENHEFAVIESSDKASALSLISDKDMMTRVNELAESMSSSKVTVPKHLQGNKGDCAAIIIQSMQWGLNPFAVAQKTHLVNGVLGYEAQLVNAVVQATKAIDGAFSYEYRGDGNSLECRVGAVLKGTLQITWGEWLKKSDVTTQNSPLWKTNPKQQMGYLQVKNWARLYAPGAILGVYTPDEIEVMPEREINPRRISGTQAAQAALPEINHDDENRKALIKRLEDVAREEGLLGFGDEWIKLSKDERKTVGEEEKERIKAIASSTNIDPEPATGEGYEPGNDD